MQSILLSIQKNIQKYTEIISKVIKLDVEVVDENLYRIAGTGIYSTHINKDMSDNGYVYKYVIKTGIKQIIFTPGEEELCQKCPDKLNCKEIFEVSTPIKSKEKVIGVIGFVCSNLDQKEILQKNLAVYLEFIDRIAELIAIKAYEQDQQEKIQIQKSILDVLVDNLDKGVILIRKDESVEEINNKGREYLGLSLTDSSYLNDEIIIYDLKKNKETNQYVVEVNGEKLIFTGKMYLIDYNNDVKADNNIKQEYKYKIFIFNSNELEGDKIISLRELEKKEILKAINLYGNTVEGKKKAARKLGIGIATLYRKLDD